METTETTAEEFFRKLVIGEFKPCIIVNKEAGLTEAIFEDVAYVAEPVFPGIYHWIDKHLAVDDGRLVGMAVWATLPPTASSLGDYIFHRPIARIWGALI